MPFPLTKLEPPSAQAMAGKQTRRDVEWNRILFLPPELQNPRIIFDPLPFREQHFTPAFRRDRRSA